ncbi:hypothetical protein J6590_084405 [Homalodisca vitripennis]|nr:hypothetical protein J6590_084405 [Homalodisca vitripennis]
MDDNGLVRIGDANQGSRKKPKTASVRTLAKLKRHGVKCALVRPKDALNTRQVLYKEAEKNKQDGIIASWVSLNNIKRKRPRLTSISSKKHNFTVKYNIISVTGKIIPVCKKFFTHITLLKATRLHNIALKIKNGIYTWTEELAGRGATVVSSAMLHFLISEAKSLSQNVHTIRLFCDGCPGQTKNNPLIHTLMYFIGTESHNLKEISITFPSREVIEEAAYHEHQRRLLHCLQSVGEVRKLGDEWSLVNTKCLSSRFRNVDHISEKKRIFLKKGKAVVEKNNCPFQSDTEQFISLQKKGWSSTKCFSTPLEPVPLGNAIKASKKKDVESLLKLMYGDEWKNNTNLSWYKIILEETPECHEIEGDEEECECDCLEPDVGLHI